MPTKRVMVAPSLAPSVAEQQDASYAVYYKDAELPIGFRGMRKTGGVYHVPFDHPIRIQTPVLKFEYIDEGVATFRVPKDFYDFMERVEDFAFREAVERRASWFKKDLNEDELRAGFKSFVREGSEVDVKVGDECVAFDERGAQTELESGARIRCIFELSGVCFGRTEFGCMWTLVQAQSTASPKCLINQAVGADFTSNFA